MRNDLLIRYLSAISDNLYRFNVEIRKDHYNNLASGRSPLCGLNPTELEFLIMKFLEINEETEKIIQILQDEIDLRK